MECKFNMCDMVPFVALKKLEMSVDIKTATPEEMLIAFSQLVWEFETAYQNLEEHEGFKWTGID